MYPAFEQALRESGWEKPSGRSGIDDSPSGKPFFY
jgi:hypothetical protein